MRSTTQRDPHDSTTEELRADPTHDLDDTTVQDAATHIAEQEAVSSTVATDISKGYQQEIPPEEGEEKKGLLGLKPTQVVGGALASCTAAVLGGQLGVAGTVAGAALTSVTIAVGGALYTQSIDKTRSGVDVMRHRFRLGGTTPATVDSAGDVATAQPPGGSGPDAKADTDESTPWYRRLSLAPILATAAMVFLLTGIVLTGLESVRGTSVSGGEGTTLGQVSRGEVTTSHNEAPDVGASDETDDTGTQDREQPATQPTEEADSQPTDQPTSDNEAGQTAPNETTTGSDGSTGTSGSDSGQGTTSGTGGSGSTGSGESGSDTSGGTGSGTTGSGGTSGSGSSESGSGAGSGTTSDSTSGSGSGTNRSGDTGATSG